MFYNFSKNREHSMNLRCQPKRYKICIVLYHKCIITGFQSGFPYNALLDTLYFALFMSCYYLSTVPVCDCTSLSSSTAAALDAFLLAVASWPNFWLAALILAALWLVCLGDILVWEGDFFLLCSYKSEKLCAPDVVEAYNILIII